MKRFVDPLLWFCVLQFVLLVFFWSKSCIKLNGICRILWIIQICSLSGLIILSLPLTATLLEKSLTSFMKKPPKGLSPDYIFVLGGGYHPGITEAQDMLGGDCYQRVLTAVTLWHQYPKAKFVISGGGAGYPERPTERLGQLMRKTAILHGVAEKQVILESHSLNTREHPIEALKLPGITSNAPIAIVTSSWHMRRAKQEFGKYFSNIKLFPVSLKNDPINVYSIIPSSNAISRSTELLREWVGMAWYKISWFKPGSDPHW